MNDLKKEIRDELSVLSNLCESVSQLKFNTKLSAKLIKGDLCITVYKNTDTSLSEILDFLKDLEFEAKNPGRCLCPLRANIKNINERITFIFTVSDVFDRIEKILQSLEKSLAYKVIFSNPYVDSEYTSLCIPLTEGGGILSIKSVNLILKTFSLSVDDNEKCDILQNKDVDSVFVLKIPFSLFDEKIKKDNSFKEKTICWYI